MRFEKIKASEAYNRIFECEKWKDKIPYLNFKSDWHVKILPPLNGAVIRFWIKSGRADLSVYLDCYEILGYQGGKPYWELCPYKDDVFRCGMDDTNALLSAIEEEIKRASSTNSTN